MCVLMVVHYAASPSNERRSSSKRNSFAICTSSLIFTKTLVGYEPSQKCRSVRLHLPPDSISSSHVGDVETITGDKKK
jgi:hypothetical protein